VFEFGEISQDALLRDVADNESSALDHPSLTDISSFGGDVQRLWATVQGLQGSCNSSVARAAQSLCSLAFRAVDACGVAAHDLPPNLLPFVRSEVAGDSDSDSQNDLQHQQPLQQPQLSQIFCGTGQVQSSSVPLTQVLHSFATIDRNLRISSPHKTASSTIAASFEDAASLVGAMASAHSLAPRLWDETIEVMRGVETLEDFAEDSSVSLLRHWHSQPQSDSDEDIEESVDDLVVDGLGPDSLLDLVVDEVDGIGDDDGLDETDSLPRLRGSRPTSASASSRRPSDRVRRSGRLQSPPDNIASSAGLGASNRGAWRVLWGGSGEISRATYAPHSLSPVPSQVQSNTPTSSSHSIQPSPPPHDWGFENSASTSHSSGGSTSDDAVDEDSDGVSRVTYSPPAPSARAWPRPSDRIPAGSRRVVSAGCSSVLSGTSTAVGADTGIDLRDSRSSDDEILWAEDSSESDEVDMLALMDALDSGTANSLDRSRSSKERSSAALSSNDDSSSNGETDYESQRVADHDSVASRGRAWAESVAFRSVNLPGAIDVALSPRSNASVLVSSSLCQDHDIVVEDVSEESDGSADWHQPHELGDAGARDDAGAFSLNQDTVQAQLVHHHPQQQLPQPQLDHKREFAASATSSNYDLSAAFEHSRNRIPVSHSDLPRLPLPSSHSHRDVTLNLAFTRASLAVSTSQEQASRYGATSSAFDASHRENIVPLSESNVMSRFHLPGNDIGRTMQALWSLQVRVVVIVVVCVDLPF
jgi:hypothetical protein